MEIKEGWDKCYCDECGKYTNCFDIFAGEEEYAKLQLCKSCLIRLLKLIIER